MSFDINKFKEKLITIDSIGLLYILAVGGLCHILPIPEIIKGFLSLPSLLIFYYLFGKGTLHFISKTFNNRDFLSILKKIDIISQFIFFWLLGYFIITFLLYLLNAMSQVLIFELGVFFIQDYILKHLFLYVFLLISLYVVITLKYNNYNLKENKYKDVNVPMFSSKILFFVMIFSVTIVSVSNIFIPFPYIGPLYISVAQDEHTSTVLLKEGYLALGTRYATVQFVSIGNIFFNLEPLTLNWVAPYMLFFLIVVGIWLFSYSISKNKYISLWASLFGSLFVISIVDLPLITLFKGNVFFIVLLPYMLFFINNNLYFVKSNTLKKELDLIIPISIFIILYLFLAIIYTSGNFEMSTYIILLKYVFLLIMMLILILVGMFYKKDLIFTFLLLSFITFTFHSQEFLLFICIVISYYFVYKIIKLNLPYFHYLIIFFVFLCFLFFILQYLGVMDISNIKNFTINVVGDVGSEQENSKFISKFNFLEERTNNVIWFFAMIGLIFVIIYRQKDIIVVFMLSFCIFLYFLPDFSTTRIEKFFYPFVGYFAGISFFYIHKLFNKKYVLPFILLTVICLLLISSLSVLESDIQLPPGYSYYPKFADYEYNACTWMKNNLSENTFLVTDRFSYFTMSPLSQKIYFMPLDMTSSMGGTDEYDKEKWRLIKEIFYSKNSEEAYNNSKKLEKMSVVEEISKNYVNIKTIKDPKFKDFSSVIVITGRTINAFDGTENLENQNILPIEWYYSLNKINPGSKYLKIFSDQKYFTLLHNNSDYLYIFGVNSEPGIPFQLKNNSK
ncbi:membrane hypothetical protein [groundwater metagenome]|uniref:Uncharacterized protein n=1 Tax=groundwater metagenome TaxID=717931 RepID=A0A098ECZ4_9ZZZZ